MKSVVINTQRAMLPAMDASVASAANPAPAETTGHIMSIAALRSCSVPPLHDNPYLDYAYADQKTRDWLYHGLKPQSPADINCLARYCIKQKLPNALSWLVLQCEVDELNLKRFYVGVEGAKMIADWLKDCPRPMKLEFSCQEIGDEGAIALADALKTCSTLTSLDLTYNFIGDEGMLAFADMLKTNSTLTSLTFAMNTICDTSAVALAEALQANSTLTTLNVSGSGYFRFGDVGAEAFAAALKSSSTLTSLDVSNNRISNTGAVAIANALKTNSTLTSLDIRNNAIGVIGAEAFAVTLKTNSTLTSLRAESNHVDKDGVTKPVVLHDYDFESAFAKYQVELDRRLDMNAKAKPLVLPAAEAFMTLPASLEWALPLEVGALIVEAMITPGPGEGDGLEGLKSLVIASDIVKARSR